MRLCALPFSSHVGRASIRAPAASFSSASVRAAQAAYAVSPEAATEPAPQASSSRTRSDAQPSNGMPRRKSEAGSAATIGTTAASKRTKKLSAVARGKQPMRFPATKSPATLANATRRGSTPQSRSEVEAALDRLNKCNGLTDELVYFCNHDGAMGQLSSRGLQHALISCIQAETSWKDALQTAEQVGRAPSTSRVKMQELTAERRALGESLLSKLHKRMSALIERLCRPSRDPDVLSVSVTLQHSNQRSNGFLDIRLYNTMLNLSLGLLKNKAAFRDIMAALRRRRIQPNNVTLTILLHHASRRKDARLAEAVVQLGIKMLHASGTAIEEAWSDWPSEALDPDSTSPQTSTSSSLASSSKSFSTHASLPAGRVTRSRLREHPVIQLLASSIKTQDSHLMLALIDLLYSFELDAFNPGSKGKSAHIFRRPWPRISPATMALYLYPSLRQQPWLHKPTQPRTEASTDAHPARDLPQHHPMVFTAMLTAVVHEGRLSIISRLWKYMRYRSLRSLQLRAPSPNLPQRSARFKNRQVHVARHPRPWKIPVRAATVYMQAVASVIYRQRLYTRRKTRADESSRSSISKKGVRVPPSGLGEESLTPERRAALLGPRTAAAHVMLARCYLFLRRHWQLGNFAAKSGNKSGGRGSAGKAGGGGGDGRGGGVGRRGDAAQQLQQPRPDRHFYAVLLNTLVPRYDGPLPFVDWLMILRRFKKRYPNGLPPPSSAPPPSQPRDSLSADALSSTAAASTSPVGEGLANASPDGISTGDLPLPNHSFTASTGAPTSPSTAHPHHPDSGSSGGRQQGRRRYGRFRALLDAGHVPTLEVELTRLVLADMKSLGIELRA